MARTKHASDYRRLFDQLLIDGQAMLLATPTDALPATLPSIIDTDTGEVAIITKVVASGFSVRDSSPGVAGKDSHGFAILDNYDNVIQSARFLDFTRHNLVFVGSATPDWQSAQPCQPVVWEPEDPIVVPPNCKLVPEEAYAATTNDMSGGGYMCYGYRVDVHTARRLGFEVHDHDKGDATPPALNYRTSMIGVEVTSSAVEIIAGRAGQHIKILDLFLRQQQDTHAPTKTFTIRQSDDTVIYKACNNNPSDFLEQKLSPGIYLDVGEGIEVLGDSGIRATVTIRYRYVDAVDVPRDHWWSYVTVEPPTPSATTEGSISTFITASTAVVPYYPRLAVSQAGAENGKQHIVEGFLFSLQKDLTVACDQLFFALTTGSAGGSVGVVASSGTTPTNNLISPIIAANAHDQCIFWTEDSIQAACAEGPTGKLWVDMSATGNLVTPANADMDVDEFHCLVWGRTIPTRVRNPNRHYEGAVS